MTKEINLSPIGTIINTKGEFAIQLNKEYIDALRGLEGFSYINVFWWASMFDKDNYRRITTCDKPYKHAPDKLGIFATRSPIRPNPIALTAVAVLNIDFENGFIHVPYLDAEDGTPVLDIKPYHPATDRIKNVNVPEWCKHWPQWYEDSAHFDWESEFTFK